MKHSLKIYAGFFVLVSLIYVILDFGLLGSGSTSRSGSTTAICIMIALTIMEIDRRLAKIENTPTQDDESTKEDGTH